MKNMNDVHNRIKAELDQWFPRQCRNDFEDYYLYYLPTTPEHDGGISICKDKPANPDLILSERIRKDLTIEQNHNRLAEVCRKLPILEY
jgi:hypothetical protein